MFCKRWGCDNQVDEKPVRPSGYRGGRYREYCGDACRMAETRRVKEIKALDLSLDENVIYQDLISKFFQKFQERGYKANKFVYTYAHQHAVERIELRRKLKASMDQTLEVKI